MKKTFELVKSDRGMLMHFEPGEICCVLLRGTARARHILRFKQLVWLHDEQTKRSEGKVGTICEEKIQWQWYNKKTEIKVRKRDRDWERVCVCEWGRRKSLQELKFSSLPLSHFFAFLAPLCLHAPLTPFDFSCPPRWSLFRCLLLTLWFLHAMVTSTLYHSLHSRSISLKEWKEIRYDRWEERRATSK